MAQSLVFTGFARKSEICKNQTFYTPFGIEWHRIAYETCKKCVKGSKKTKETESQYAMLRRRGYLLFFYAQNPKFFT